MYSQCVPPTVTAGPDINENGIHDTLFFYLTGNNVTIPFQGTAEPYLDRYGGTRISGTEWIFDDYLANSAEDWEQYVSGIYELYWRDVDMSRQMAERVNCIGGDYQLPEFNLIETITYETEFGKIEFWEEIRTVKLPGMNEQVELISPYMRIWIFHIV